MVNNMPKDESRIKKYIVVREAEGVLWYWGSWDELDRAYIAAKEVNGTILTKENADG